MNHIDLSPLTQWDHAHRQICVELARKLNAGWDDTVKESFLQFIHQIERNGEELHSARISAEEIEKSIVELDVNQKCRNADLLAEEAYSI